MKTLRILFFLIVITSCETNNKVTEKTIRQVDSCQVDNTPNTKKEIVKTEPQAKPKTKLFKTLTKQLSAKGEAHTVNITRDTVITGSKGTQFYFPANSIISQATNVNLELKEAYSTSDCIRYNLETTSNGQRLVTNGMFSLNTSTKGAKINPEKPIQVKFPAKNKISNDVFVGVRDNAGSINWIPQNQTTLPGGSFSNNLVREGETSQPIPFHAKDTLLKYVKYPPKLYRSNKRGTVVLNIDINALGGVDTVKLINDLTPEIDHMILKAVKKIKYWRPTIMNGYATRTSIRLSFKVNDSRRNFAIDLPFITKPSLAKQKKVALWVNSFKTKIDEWSIKQGAINRMMFYTQKSNEMIGYVFKIKKWGWVNCDYFYRVPQEFLAKVKIQLPLDVNAKLIMSGEKKSILNIKNNFDTKLTEQTIDIRQKNSIFAIKNEESSWYIAIKEIKGIPQSTINLDFQKVTLVQLNKKLNELDNI